MHIGNGTDIGPHLVLITVTVTITNRKSWVALGYPKERVTIDDLERRVRAAHYFE